MTIDHVAQLTVTCFGPCGFFMLNSPTLRWRRRGVICGWISQPAWYATAMLNGQWLMLPVFMIYTFGWIRATRRNFRKEVT